VSGLGVGAGVDHTIEDFGLSTSGDELHEAVNALRVRASKFFISATPIYKIDDVFSSESSSTLARKSS
jgi:hypothetical protein